MGRRRSSVVDEEEDRSLEAAGTQASPRDRERSFDVADSGEGRRRALGSRFAGAPEDAPAWKTQSLREVPREDLRLVEAAHPARARMERNGDDEIGLPLPSLRPGDASHRGSSHCP